MQIRNRDNWMKVLEVLKIEESVLPGTQNKRNFLPVSTKQRVQTSIQKLIWTILIANKNVVARKLHICTSSSVKILNRSYNLLRNAVGPSSEYCKNWGLLKKMNRDF